MRILYLHQYFCTPEGSGGTRSYEFARRLIDKGYRVRIVTSSAVLPKSCNKKGLFWEGQIENIPMTVINVPYSNFMTFSERMVSFFKFAVISSILVFRYRVDIVFATSTPLTIAIPAILAKLIGRVPMVFEVRDLWPDLPIAIGALRNSLLKTLALALEKLAYKASKRIVALSPGMKDGIRGRGIAPDKIHVIPNSCDTLQFDIPASEGNGIRQRLGISKSTPLVVYTGTMGMINGVDYLVDLAFESARMKCETKFLIVGTGFEREKVVKKAVSLGVLNNNLWIWKPVPKSEVPKILSASTVATSLFVPLKPMWNNSANKFFDALAAGKPVAINYGGWQADLLRESGAGITLPPENHKDAALVLNDFITDPITLKRASDAAKNIAYTQFERNKLTIQLESVFKDVIAVNKYA